MSGIRIQRANDDERALPVFSELAQRLDAVRQRAFELFATRGGTAGHELDDWIAAEHEVLVTIEEGAIGGFSTQVLHFLAREGLLDQGLKVRPMTLPDRFIDHDTPVKQYDEAGLNARHVVATTLAALGRNDIAMPATA